MKKIISLDFIIIFIGGFLFLMSWPSATILHFLLFFCASVFYFWVDYRRGSLFQKQLALFIVIFVVLGTAFVTEISARRHDDSIFVHDNVLQVESAAQILWQGRNPYAENYFGTELEKFSYISTVSGQLMLNPALFHCIKLPFHLLFSVPFYLLFNNLWQFFDERLVYLILFIISLFALYQLPKRTESKFALAAAYAFNPLFSRFFLEGRDDVFVLAWLILTFYLLQKEKLFWSAVALAIACASKHSAWFFVPFYYAYLYFNLGAKTSEPILGFCRRIKTVLRLAWPLPVLFILIIMPFVVWDPLAFFQDIYAYPAGTLSTSFPINGYGWSVVLYELGLVKNITDYVPLWLVQIPITIALYYFLIKNQRRRNSLAYSILDYAVLIFVYWFFSRFFHDNYVGFVSQLFIIAYFLADDSTGGKLSYV